VGTARADTVRLMAEVLQSRGVERAVVLHSEDGLDELSLAAPATVVDVDTETISARRIDAAVELGASHPSSALRGGDVATNARAVHEFLASAPGAIFDVVTATAGLALVVAGRADDLREGAALAADAVRRGDGRRVLDELVRASNAS
jgi:anthranilate phosphoribosyltransferase